MNKDFFDKNINEQLHILEEENFFSKNELEQIEFLRENGFFELEISQRIHFLENAGLFHLDVNDDPPTIPLTLDQVDFLTKIRQIGVFFYTARLLIKRTKKK